MSGVGVEFVGGPLDGRQQWINADPMNPPARIEFTSAPASWRGGASESPPPPAVRLVYAREPSGRDDGPLWLYRWGGEHA